MEAEFLFLGTGGSAGIPMIACHCSVCTSSDPHDKRLRPSALISCGHKKLLIDAGPDFRQQALRYHINYLNALLLTHSHFDHIGGLDELRVYYILQHAPLPVLISEPTYNDLKRRYDYLFRQRDPTISLTAQFDFHVLQEERGEIQFLDFNIRYLRYEQAGMPVLGFRFGSLAYISDIRSYSEAVFEDLKGVKILILSALRHRASIMHLTLDEAVDFAQKIGAETTYFTHMSHELEHKTTEMSLPEGIFLAYDGLKFNFDFNVKPGP